MTREYWKIYYERNKEKILAKNRAWSKSPEGKKLVRIRRHALIFQNKPDRKCVVCDTHLNKITKQRMYCSQKCVSTVTNKAYYEKIKADPIKYAAWLEKRRIYQRQYKT